MTDFNFLGFEPDDEMKVKAHLAVDRLLEIAPYGSMVVALLQKNEDDFRCAIEIYSKQGPFIASVSHKSAEAALESVVRTLLKKLGRWMESRSRSQRNRSRYAGAKTA